MNFSSSEKIAFFGFGARVACAAAAAFSVRGHLGSSGTSGHYLAKAPGLEGYPGAKEALNTIDKVIIIHIVRLLP